MKFTFLITADPFDDPLAYSAYQFAETVLQQGHEISQLFFYRQGIYHALPTQLAPDECALSQRWQQLANQYQLSLAVCRGAAEQRGLTSHNILPGFQLSSLAEHIVLSTHADRYLRFGN